MSKESEFYRAILDSLSDGVYFVDAQRQITYWNKAAEHITGFTSAQVVGSSCADNLLVHVNEGGDFPQPQPAVTQPFVKGDQTSPAEITAGSKQFWATRGTYSTVVAAAFPLLAATPFFRYQLILVGTKLANSRFVAIKQPVGNS